MSKHVFRSAGASLLVIASLSMATTAYAQDAGDEGSVSAEDDGDAGGNVIIVTAQKREQDILEVPVAVSAFSDASLEAAMGSF